MKKPNFLCIGFTKCGTTTLHQIFRQHPDIYLPKIKETKFYYPEFYNRGFEWYLKRFFSGVKNEHAIGEINPNFSSKYSEDKIIKDFGKHTKIIFIVRNPVNRLFSHYKYFLRYGWSFNNINLCVRYAKNHKKGFNQFMKQSFIKKKDGSIILTPSVMRDAIQIGKYYSNINAYMKNFPAENIKIILFEEFIKDIEFTSKQLFEFIGVSKNVNINYNIIANEGNLVPKNINSIYLLQMIFQLLIQIQNAKYDIADGFVIDFKEFLQRKFILAPDIDKNGMSKEAKQFLEDYYRDEKNKLELLMKRDLSNIWFK